MKIAVTGASGLVGGQVVRAALADGHEVTAIVHSTGSAQLHGLHSRQVRAGLMDARRMGKALRESSVWFTARPSTPSARSGPPRWNE